MQEKCKFSICTVKIWGHKVSKDEIKADPDKKSVILKIKPLLNATQLEHPLSL